MHVDIRHILIGALDGVERQILEHIPVRPGHHLIQFDMNHWVAHFTKNRSFARPSYVAECGAAACLAGHVAVKLGWPRLDEGNMSDTATLSDFPFDHPLRNAALAHLEEQFTQDGIYIYTYWGRHGELQQPEHVPFQQAVDRGLLNSYDIGVGEVVRRYLDIPLHAWGQLTMTPSWAPKYEHRYNTAETELERVRITREWTVQWLDAMERFGTVDSLYPVDPADDDDLDDPDDPDDDFDDDAYLEEEDEN